MSDRTSEQNKLEGAWDRSTSYGRADLTLHPIIRQAYKIACLIEMCGASEALTRASSEAFDHVERLSDMVLAFCSQGIADEAKIKELEELVEQFNDGHTPPEEPCPTR